MRQVRQAYSTRYEQLCSADPADEHAISDIEGFHKKETTKAGTPHDTFRGGFKNIKYKNLIYISLTYSKDEKSSCQHTASTVGITTLSIVSMYSAVISTVNLHSISDYVLIQWVCI